MSRERNALRKKMQNKKKRTEILIGGLITIAVVAVLFLIVWVAGYISKPKAEAAVSDALELYRAQDSDAFAEAMTLGVSELYFPESGMTQTLIDAFTEIDYSIVGSSVLLGGAKVDVDITGMFFPDIYYDIYLNEYMQLYADVELTDDNEEEMSEAVTELLDTTIINNKNVFRKTERITVELKKTKGRWLIVPDWEFVNALLGFQYDPSASEYE